MTARSRRAQIATWCVLIAFAVVLSWSYLRMVSSREAAQAAAANLAICKSLGQQIVGLRDKPSFVALAARSPTEIARGIEQAASRAGIPTDTILRIDPNFARRVGDTAYKQQPTALELRPVTLKQLVMFLIALTEGDDGLEVEGIRLTPPRQGTAVRGDDEVWRAEVTLTKLIFSPKTPDSEPRG